MISKNEDQKLFGFHIGKGSHISIWAVSQKEAIGKFRAMCPDVPFVTDAEYVRREKQRENNIPLMATAA